MLANVGIERAIISSLCQYGKDAMVEIEDVGVVAESFTLVTNQALFTSIKQLLDNKDKIDQAMLFISIRDLGYGSLFDNKKDVEFVASLFSFPIRADNVRGFAVRLEKMALARKAITKHQEAIEALEQVTGVESVESIIQISENPIFDLILDISRTRDSGPSLLFEDIDELVQTLRNNRCDNIGIPTPWPTYNAAIGGGLRRGGVNLIGARPKIGKTTFAKEAILHITGPLKVPVLMLDTEMSGRDQAIRSLASCGEVPLDEIETGRFSKNRLYSQYIDNAALQLKNNKHFWYASIAGKPFDEVLATIRRWIVKTVGYDDNGVTNNCVVAYDYFKLMDSSQLNHLKEYEAMGYQISRLTDFCKEFDFPCLAFVQLNRQNDISQSDRLRWLCHSYSQFMLKDPQERVDDGPAGGNRKVQVMDTRYGPGLSDGDYICMNFKGDVNQLTEIGLKSKLGEVEDDDKEFQIDFGKSEIVKTEIVGPPLLEYDDTNKDEDEEPPWDAET